MDFTLIFLLVIGLALSLRLVAGSIDGDRVKKYVHSRGGRLLDQQWSPFGKGWFGEKDSRIYAITYVDRDGHTHKATCKTSALSGVYFTEDNIVKYNPQPGTAATADQGETRASQFELEEENRRLRAEVERLRQQRN